MIARELLIIADSLEEQARKIRVCVAKIQREKAQGQEAEVLSFIDEVNKYREEAGLPLIVPLITDSL